MKAYFLIGSWLYWIVMRRTVAISTTYGQTVSTHIATSSEEIYTISEKHSTIWKNGSFNTITSILNSTENMNSKGRAVSVNYSVIY